MQHDTGSETSCLCPRRLTSMSCDRNPLFPPSLAHCHCHLALWSFVSSNPVLSLVRSTANVLLWCYSALGWRILNPEPWPHQHRHLALWHEHNSNRSLQFAVLIMSLLFGCCHRQQVLWYFCCFNQLAVFIKIAILNRFLGEGWKSRVVVSSTSTFNSRYVGY